MKIMIGVQGIQGSFSEMAGKEFALQSQLNDYALAYLISSENVLSALDQRRINYGIFAIENAQGGVVIESIYALAKYRCTIQKMFSIRIVQNLLVQPGTKKDDVREIHSHQQALKQCQNYLQQHFPHCQLIEAADTALAAKLLSENQLSQNAAVISNRICADLYHLNVLAENIQDLKNNMTLFIAAVPFIK